MAKKEYIERPAGKNENDIIENPMILETSGKGKEKAAGLPDYQLCCLYRVLLQ